MTATQLFLQWIAGLKDKAKYSPDAIALEAFCAGHAAAQPKPVEWVKATQYGEGKYTGHAWITDGKYVYHGRVDQGFPIVAHISGFDGWTHYAPITPPAPPEQKE